nr:MAG TPA: hypothetical protein [Caudoviricetes sp.]
MIKDIRRYCKQLSLGKIPQSDFFAEVRYELSAFTHNDAI